MTVSTQDIFNMTDTWNAGGTTFTAVKMNVTDTASAAASLLMDLQVGGTSKFSIKKDGTFVTIGGSTSSFPALKRSSAALHARLADDSDYADFRCGTLQPQVAGASYGQISFGTGNGFMDADLLLLRSRDGSTSTTIVMGPSNNTTYPAIGRSTVYLTNPLGDNTLPGLIDAEVFATTQVVTSLTNNSSAAQNVFASANDVLTLRATTTYFFECLYFINTGATTHTTATGFVASSAFTGISYFAELWSTTAGAISTTAPSVLDVTASTATVLNATSTATRTTIRCRGMIRTNAATTVTPQITFSAGPTGTCEIAVNSYFRAWPVGSNTVASFGDWA